jgi:hypothetical protein
MTHCSQNWPCVLIGYHGRSSSINVRGRPLSLGAAAGRIALGVVRRPCGQVMINSASSEKGSKYGLTSLPNFELEVALVVNGRTNIEHVSGGWRGGGCWGGTMIGRPMIAKEAQGKIFGYVRMNVWSTRDVQRWECILLGPFTSKNENKRAVIWVRANRTMASPRPLAPVAIPPLLSYLSGGSDGRKNPMGRILRHEDKDNDDDDDGYYGGGYGNGGMVRG